eukprot:g6991.t1
MKIVGRKGMRCALAALGLLAVVLALITPKGFLVTAEVAEDAAASAAAAVEAVEEGGDDEPAIPGATVQVLTEENFERLTQVSTGATTGDWFVKFYAPWCGHCRKLEPTWNELAEKLGGEVNVAKVDVTANSSLGKRFGIKGFPTLMYFSHGNMYKFSGLRKVETLMAYAKGGFKTTESVAVPEPPSLVGGIKDVLSGIVKDAKGLKDGKMPSHMTIIAMTGAMLLLMLIAAIRTPTKPRSEKKKE